MKSDGRTRWFRAKRGGIDQVFTIRQVKEKAVEKSRELFVAFIDLEKAYVRVAHRNCR